MRKACACGGFIEASGTLADVASAVDAHNRSQRHERWRSKQVYREPVEVYVEPTEARPAVQTVLGPCPCIACGGPVRVERYPGGTLLVVHANDSLACPAVGVAG